jgi:sugar transferase EpsL
MPCSKRVFDLIAACISIVLLAPFFLLAALIVLVSFGPPVLFAQLRPGYKGRPFRIRKFRTMTEDRDLQGQPLSDSVRLTRLGRLMRSSSLDELPELINILRGEMSFVGPRPLLMEYLPLYTPDQMRRHDVVPGLTGWAQINGRNVIDWDDRFKLDLWYVDHWSFLLDVKIIALTLWKVIKREGISQPGHATMAPFKGSQH